MKPPLPVSVAAAAAQYPFSWMLIECAKTYDFLGSPCFLPCANGL